MVKEISRGITVDYNVMDGKPVIKGTCLPVDLILMKISEHRSIDDVLSEYPELTMDQIKNCFRYAAILLQRKRRQRYIIPW
jgi:uncharacterized protein (DUF433 family)